MGGPEPAASYARPPAVRPTTAESVMPRVCTGGLEKPYPSAAHFGSTAARTSGKRSVRDVRLSLGSAPRVALRGGRSSRLRGTIAHPDARPTTTISMLRGGHMRQRSLGLTLFAGLAIIVSACGPGATPSPSASAPASQPPASAPASAPASVPASQAAASMTPLKVGVVTDVGQLEDKSFNQSSNEGAEASATATGGTHDVIVTQSISDYG